MEAAIRTGQSILPGDRVMVKVHPYRTWGTGRLHIDNAAEPVMVEATVETITFQREDGNIVWCGQAFASVPIFDKKGICENRWLTT